MSGNGGFSIIRKLLAPLNDYFPLVCRVIGGNNILGTGFLVGPDLILTNYHVYEHLSLYGITNCIVKFEDDEEHYIFRENYDFFQCPPDRDEQPSASTDGDYHQNIPDGEWLDYAILRLNKRAGDSQIRIQDSNYRPAVIQFRGWVRLLGDNIDCAEVTNQEDIILIHHPGVKDEAEAIYTQVDKFNNNQNLFEYKFEKNKGTIAGSSGGLIFSRKSLKIVGLHQKHEGDTPSKKELKKGIPITKITQQLAKLLSEERLVELSQRPSRKRRIESAGEDSIGFANEFREIISNVGNNLSDDEIFLSYLLSLPSGTDLPSRFDFVLAVQELMIYPTNVRESHILDFIMAIKNFSRDLSLNANLHQLLQKLSNIYPKTNFQEAVRSSEERISQRMASNNKISLRVDIKDNLDNPNNEENLFDVEIFISIFGKQGKISGTDFLGIRSRMDFVNRFGDFWYEKVQKFRLHCPSSTVEIFFRVTRCTLSWEIDQQKISHKNYPRYGFALSEKYPVWYSSIERQEIFEMRDSLERAWSTDGKEGVVFKVKRKDLTSKGAFQKMLQRIPDGGTVICVLSDFPLELSNKEEIYDLIIAKQIPAFIWSRSQSTRVPRNISKSIQGYNMVDIIRRNIANGMPPPHSKYYSVLFDDPDVQLP